MPAPKGHPRYGGKPKGYKAKHTLEKEAARELVRMLVTQELEPLVLAQIANAKGLSYLVTRDKKTGKFVRVTEAMARARVGSHEEIIEVWEKDPSVFAFADLLNRAIDKPKEQPFDVKVGAMDELLGRLNRGRLRVAEARRALPKKR